MQDNKQTTQEPVQNGELPLDDMSKLEDTKPKKMISHKRPVRYPLLSSLSTQIGSTIFCFFNMPLEQQNILNHVIFDSVTSSVNTLILRMLYITLGSTFGKFLYRFCFFILSERIGLKIRKLYFSSLLRQDSTFYDSQETGTLTSHISIDVQNIQKGISQNFGLLFEAIASPITGYVIGFVKCWDLSLVILSIAPFMILGTIFMGSSTKVTRSKGDVYDSKAGAIAEETLGSIRTVQSFNQEKAFSEIYSQNVKSAQKWFVIGGHFLGIGMGFVMFTIFCSITLGLFYGTVVLRGDGGMKNVTAGAILVVFMSNVISTMSLSKISMPASALAISQASAYKIYQIIDRIPDIDATNTEGLKPSMCEGKVRFEGVKFNYPTRETKSVLDGLDFEVKQGETCAFVGASGCGKSTTVQLLQRNYEVTEGSIYLDDRNLKEYNIKWLREQIGIVMQEPSLFGFSIRDNITLGAKEDQSISDEEVVEAAKTANCHEFISAMPEGYNTVVGDRGSQLSGGQKQRIAIARALIRNPKVLILDEATSALDTQSEKEVQNALENAAKGRTTIIIAHRLSTIKNATKICVFENGKIIESGSHAELMDLKGTYYEMVCRQQTTVDDTSEIVSENKTKEEHNDTTIKTDEASGEPSDIENRLQKDIEDEKKKMKKSNKRVFLRTFIDSLKHEYVLTILSMIGGIGQGAIFPFYSIKFMDIMMVMLNMEPGVQPSDDQKKDIRVGCLTIFGLGCGIFLAMYFLFGLSFISGEKLISRMRSKLYSKLLIQNIGYFDYKENGVGKVVTRLSSDPTNMKGMAGLISNVMSIVSSFGFGIGIGIYYQYKTGLCLFAIVPLALLVIYLNGKLNSAQSSPALTAYLESSSTLVEAIENVRTVHSLSKEKYFYTKFEEQLKVPKRNILKWAPILSFVGAANNFMPNSFNCYGIYIGTLMIKKSIEFNTNTTDFMNDFVVQFINMQKSILCISMVAGVFEQLDVIVQDFGKAKKSARAVFNTIDRKRPIDISSEDGEQPNEVKGEIEFKHTFFRYPTRPERCVLDDVSFKIKHGETYAFVGASGCGKSTTVSLIERFYDPTAGEILLDNINIKNLNLEFLRKQIGMVNQEHVLFNESILDNIKRGKGDGDNNISDEEVVEAAKTANCHDFISAMPEGYNTVVGDRGSQLSGGQKQRIAIARALIRNPKVLILDEATSALDTQSEKEVQNALENAAKGRTTIIIAHRLSTIKNATKICVFENGKIIESGSHAELMDLKGTYSTLVTSQKEEI
ncbi:bile salt export pump, putative [Entamoeba invadens IP1]|uniref:Bile salt export pump, putative n=1 Tax=Entamoeba invadens IP1 TaxID=370355 RepID=A0A0A1U3G9_ENTIV|nr:bile salt export pump, putative [Entamoeba invadens IP1]ELP88602.1 bile salt export pump, putative [Entamoeba invadens IP1]|eukprot:XP_004255373.1 bile salt export pump, putative [Entamoeba invadens IP1]